MSLMVLDVLQMLAAGACLPGDPGPGCPCKLEEFPTSGACPAGYQCAPQSELGHIFADSAQGSAASGGICVPCSLGQYCPRGTVLPIPGSPEASNYVAKYACRSAILSLSIGALHFPAYLPHIMLPIAVKQLMEEPYIHPIIYISSGESTMGQQQPTVTGSDSFQAVHRAIAD